MGSSPVVGTSINSNIIIMTFTAFFFAFSLAVTTFYVNQRLHKMTNIKITINSFFDIFAQETSFDEFDKEDVVKRLMDEIIAIEKVIDVNFYVDIELHKIFILIVYPESVDVLVGITDD